MEISRKFVTAAEKRICRIYFLSAFLLSVFGFSSFFAEDSDFDSDFVSAFAESPLFEEEDPEAEFPEDDPLEGFFA